MIYKIGDHPNIEGNSYSFHPLMNFDEDKSFTVNEGEVMHFIADKRHYYCNETENLAKAFVLMFYCK